LLEWNVCFNFDWITAPATIIPGPRQVIGQLDQLVQLPCNTSGLPKPAVTWWKNTRMLPLLNSSNANWQFELGPNNELRIRQMTVEDLGVYTCQAHNSYGPIQVWDVSLLLEFDTHVKVKPTGKVTDELALHSSSAALVPPPPPLFPAFPPTGTFSTAVLTFDGTVQIS
jgi:peroxidase